MTPSETVIFLGPSLGLDAARALLDADYRPPVSQGDVYRAVQQGARVVGLIDGFFERVPAVWHKEILWALSRGVHVFGASSMGALRAAELAAFGMRGIGRVFEDFRDGVLEDDDEVTIVHGPAELGYPAASEAMVNIRATLARACDEDVLDPPGCEALLCEVKRLYYPLRSFPRMLEAASRLIPEDRVRALALWLPRGRIDRKRDDAVALLTHVRAFLEEAPAPFQAAFHFEHTDAWEQAVRRIGHLQAAAVRDDLPPEALIDELRLDHGAYARAMTGALARALALREAARAGTPVARDVFRDVLNGFFLQRGLATPAEIGAWLARQEIDADGLTAFIARQVQVGQADVLFRQETLAQLPDVLRAAGSYGDLARRARRKRQWLDGITAPSIAMTGLSEQELLSWHFVDRRAEAVPDDLDRHSAMLGLPNRFAFLTLLVEDYLFERDGEGQCRPVPRTA
ncbi:MAG: hypothetical protein F8N37_20740 [Telmatospirillum sp.]|nr:hypothetical protein [Telmatospirillum sp.]